MAKAYSDLQPYLTFVLAVTLCSLQPRAIHAAPWTLPQGASYANVVSFWTSSEHFYNATSERTLFLNNGTSRVFGFSVEGSHGLTSWLMLSGNLPVLWYKLQDDVILDEGRSLGDLRASTRIRTPFHRPVVAAIEAGIKFPTASTKDPARAQVGEGQYDFELLGSVGKRLPLLGVRVSVDAGYRWRRRNADTGFKPSNEVLYRMELGYDASRRLSFNTLVDGFKGGDGDARVFGLTSSTLTARNLVVLAPNITYRLNRNFELMMASNVPLAGKRSYAGKQFVLGLAYNRADLNQVFGLGGFSNPRGGSCCTIQ